MLRQFVIFILLLSTQLFGAESSVYDIPPDLVLPPTVAGKATAGKRVRQTTPGWENTSVYHSVYLPSSWSKDSSFPVIVEYPGNGGYKRGLDVSHGTVENCALGYGLSAKTDGKGTEAIWICLPFVDVQDGSKQNCTIWWGDVEETKRYCIATVRDVCKRYGGDPKKILLAGFSRGAIACFFIGLHDDEIASLWSGFFAHSHLDGVRENWPYPGADRVSATARLKRLGERPVWVSQEGGPGETQRYLESTGIRGSFTFGTLPYPNHTTAWMLRPLPLRTEARLWWTEITK